MSDAKPMTSAEVEALPAHAWGPTAYRNECPNHVLVRRDDLLATTRALEKLEEGLRLWHGLPPDERAMIAIENAGKMWRQAVAEQDSAIARAEKAEAERDEARAEVARRDALISSDGYEDMRQHAADLAQRLANAERERDEARSDNIELRCQLVDLSAKSAKAERERDTARARVAALETALLDACREKVVHGHTTTIWTKARQLEVPGIEELGLHADQLRSEAKTLVSELVDAAERLLEHYSDGLPDHLVDEFRAALAKAKEATNG